MIIQARYVHTKAKAAVKGRLIKVLTEKSIIEVDKIDKK